MGSRKPPSYRAGEFAILSLCNLELVFPSSWLVVEYKAGLVRLDANTILLQCDENLTLL